MPDDKAFGVLQTVTQADPSRAFEAALLEVVAVLVIDSFGRQPNEYACRFAAEEAAKP